MEGDEKANDLAEKLATAIQRIERLEESSHRANDGDPSSSMRARPFVPPMRQLATASRPTRFTSQIGFPTPRATFQSTSSMRFTSAHAGAINQDFRRAFPSIGGGGSRQMLQRKKPQRKQQNIIFVQPKDSWTHDFCLLSEKGATRTPTTSNLISLKEAGLGKRKITFDDKRSSHGKVRQVLETVYPKLKSQGGAFELLRADRGGVNSPLVLISMSPQGYTVPHLKEQVSTNTVLYIRPMQSNLPLSKVISHTDDCIKTNCRNCCREVPLASMRSHMAQCTQGESTCSSTTRNEVFDEWSDEEFIDAIKEIDDEGTDKQAQGVQPSCKLDVRPEEESFREQEWKRELINLFPSHSKSQIDVAVIGCSSLEEAANNLLEETPFNHEKEKETPKAMTSAMSEEALPKRRKLDDRLIPISGHPNLNSLLSDFQHFKSDVGFEEIQVDRDAIWSDVLKYYKRKVAGDASDLAKTFEVNFKGEEGLDGGSVKIEFFNMAWEHVQKRLFEGNIKRLVPIKDVTKMFLFRLCGMMVVHTVVQGGPVQNLPQLAPSVVSALIGESIDEVYSHLSKHDIPLNAATENLHYLVEELDAATDDKSVTDVFASAERSDAYWQIVNSSHWPVHEPVKNCNKSSFIQEIMYNEIIRSRNELIKEMRCGLDTLGFFAFISKYPDQFKELLSVKEIIFGPEEFKSLLQETMPSNFSQKQAYEWFLKFIETGNKAVDKDDDESRLKALLAFTTGWQTPQPGVSISIKLEFLPDDDIYSLPTSSACVMILRLPTVHSSEKKFEQAMVAALKHARRGFPNP